MQYSEYEELYSAQNPIPEDEFAFYDRKAEALIEGYTFGRSRDSELDEVKYAEAELAQYLFESGGRRGVLSESNDGLSVSYGDGDDDGESYAIVKQWLGWSGMLYAGV